MKTLFVVRVIHPGQLKTGRGDTLRSNDSDKQDAERTQENQDSRSDVRHLNPPDANHEPKHAPPERRSGAWFRRPCHHIP
jgi:hypothetical protein